MLQKISIRRFLIFTMLLLQLLVATSPICIVDKSYATASDDVTYTCSATAVCGNTRLTIEKDRSVQATHSDCHVEYIQAAENQSSFIVNFNNVCFSASTSPNCTVDKPSAASSEDVTYICSVMPVCGMIDVPLTIEKDGSVPVSYTHLTLPTKRIV